MLKELKKQLVELKEKRESLLDRYLDSKDGSIEETKALYDLNEQYKEIISIRNKIDELEDEEEA